MIKRQFMECDSTCGLLMAWRAELRVHLDRCVLMQWFAGAFLFRGLVLVWTLFTLSQDNTLIAASVVLWVLIVLGCPAYVCVSVITLGGVLLMPFMLADHGYFGSMRDGGYG